MTNPTPTDWRALCAELTKELEFWSDLACTPSELPYEKDDLYRLIERARAALAQPEPRGPKPAPDYGRVPEIATEAQIRSAAQYLIKKQHCDGDLIPAIEYAIARWGHTTIQPEPQGPTDEELREMWLSQEWFNEGATFREFASIVRRYGRPAIKPVPVTERPWEREGWCDAEGRCWFGAPPDGAADAGWILRKPSERLSHQTVSLPHHALPVPAAEVEP